jgi:hypothetical protein
MLDADCHVLVTSRNKEAIERFLNTFLPERKCATDGLIVEENTEREREITDENELIEFCIKRPTEACAIYWQGLNEHSRRCAWICFTEDGATIYGLTCFEENEAQEDELLEKLKQHVGSRVGYISYVKPPPQSASEYTDIFNAISKASK